MIAPADYLRNNNEAMLYENQISYEELRELSYMGASVLHEETIFPVQEMNIPIKELITHTFPLDKLNEAMEVNVSQAGIKICYIAD